MGGTRTSGWRTALLITLSLLLATTLVTAITPEAQAQDGDVVIEIVSNRADLLSGGTALVEVTIPDPRQADSLAVDVDGTDVSDAFASRPNGRIMGLVTDIPAGESTLTATIGDGRGARIDLTNHPVGGPIFSGPQIQPWTCTTEDQGLGAPTDAQCNAPTLVEYRYMPEGGTDLEPYDVDDPPTDVAMTTTDQDKEVPFIVRYERGTMNRGVYALAVLEDPENPMAPWDPDAHAWNHKIHYPYGESCAVHQGQTTPIDVISTAPPGLTVHGDIEGRLGQGFMIATNSLNNLGDNCSTVTSAEAAMMLQEHISEQFGEIRFVIGTGCWGGSIGQNMISNNYPGLLDGIIPNCTYVDNYSTALEVIDCHVLLNHVSATSPQLWASPQAQTALFDQAGPGPCAAWDVTFAPISDPTTGCALPEDQIYDPETNPEGVRCTLQDYMIALWGERPESEWGPVEQEIERGFANAPYDNVGVEYGLKALREGTITPAQFLDVNANLQTVDVDFTYVEGRTEANDATIETIYRSGSYNDARQMDEVAIIDLRGSSNVADIHTDFHTYALRQRLVDVHGDHDNAVVWTWQARGAIVVGITPTLSMGNAAFRVMDEWLTAVEADDSQADKAAKIKANRPDEATDKCFGGDEYETELPLSQEECEQLYPHFGAPRTGATMPISHNVAKCVLVPLPAELPEDGSYGQPAAWTVTNTSWEDYRAAQPDGVCDYTQDVEQRVESVPWLSFADGPGGQPIGPAPVSVPFRLADAELERFSGETRIETAIAVSGRDRESATTVVLARADNFPDALAAAPVAVDLDAPLLLTNPGSLAQATADEIARLAADEVVIVGGPVAISAAVEAELTGDGLAVRRIEGDDRTATAAAANGELDGLSRIFVANSDSFADALTASTLAAVLGEGFLLVETDQVPTATAAALTDGVDVTIVGDEAAVSTAVEDALDEAAGELTRISADSVYATSVAAARLALAEGASSRTVWIATGEDYPDALVAGAAAARDGGVLVLVDGGSASGSVDSLTFFDELAGRVQDVRVSGGPIAVSEAAADAVLSALRG